MDCPWEVICPACGALVEAADREELVVRAREHTLDAHHYEIPRGHVLDSAVPADTDASAATRCGAGQEPFSWESR